MSINERRRAAVLLLVTWTGACGNAKTDQPLGSGTGGTSSSGGAVAGGSGGSAGASAVGGMPATAGASAGGTTAMGGDGGEPQVVAGAANAGTGPVGGAGGEGAGGTAGAMDAGAAGASGAEVSESPGCGQSTGMPTDVNVPNAIVTFPQNYDGSTPVPMLFGFHGAGRTHEEFHEVDARTGGSVLEEQFVMVYLKAAGSAWVASDVSRLDTAYDQITQNYCIDMNRVFATGHSSGAHFIETLLCEGEQRFAGVAPVAGSFRCDSWDAVPAMLIHGSNDQERVGLGDADGQQELAPFVTSNGCEMATTPYSAAQSCNSIHDQAAVNHGCVAYEGCAEPFVFCSHDDQNYGDTNHGWPCFANQTMYDFFSGL